MQIWTHKSGQMQETKAIALNLGGIKNKLMSKADWIAYVMSAWERIPDMDVLFKHITDFSTEGALGEIGKSLTWKGADGSPLIVWKLMKSGHLYSSLFKVGGLAMILDELNLGIIPKQYLKVGKKLVMGSIAAALTMPGSGVPPSNSGGKSPSGSWGNH